MIGTRRDLLEKLLQVAIKTPDHRWVPDLGFFYQTRRGNYPDRAPRNMHQESCGTLACLAGWAAADKELNPNNATVMDWSLDFRVRVSETWNDLFGTRRSGDWDSERGTSALTAKQLAIYRIYRAIGYLQHQALPMTIEATKGA